jgi:glycine/D-amino acid oxidase-like deaminating enzyme
MLRDRMLTPKQAMSVNPYQQVTAFAEDFVRQGGRIVRDRITGIDLDGRRVTGVRGDGAVCRAAHVVVAAGAWSSSLLAPLGSKVSLERQRGYHFMLGNSGVTPSRAVVAVDRKLFVTLMEMGLRVAGTVEFAAPSGARRAAVPSFFCAISLTSCRAPR